MSGVPLEGIIFIGALVSALISGMLFLRFVESRKLQKRIERVTQRRPGAVKTVSESVLRKRKPDELGMPLLRTLSRMLPKIRSLSNKLERAEMEISAQGFLLICILLMGLAFAGVTLGMGKSPKLGFFVCILVGLWIPFKVLNFRSRRQVARFLKLFPDAIDLMVRGLRSGLPIAESMNSIAKEIPDPIGSSFSMITSWIKLGVPMEKALQDMAKKLDLTEFNFFVTSVILQRETGGNLSEILNNLSEVLRKRTMMQMKIKAMTGEARTSSLIIGALPFLVAGAASFMSPGYLDPLFNDVRGNIALTIAAVMLVGGMWLMRRMAKFEI